jgi:hypothetical protein
MAVPVGALPCLSYPCWNALSDYDLLLDDPQRQLPVESGQADRVLTRADLRIFDVEPIVPVEPEVTLLLNRLTPFLSGASGAAAVDDAFRVGLISTATALKQRSVRRSSLPSK